MIGIYQMTMCGNIDANIPKKERRRIWAFLPFILAGLAILCAVVLGLDNYNKNNRINELQRELDRCGKNDNEIDKSIGSLTPLPNNNNLVKRKEQQNQALIENNLSPQNEKPNNSKLNSKVNTSKKLNNKLEPNLSSERSPSDKMKSTIGQESSKKELSAVISSEKYAVNGVINTNSKDQNNLKSLSQEDANKATSLNPSMYERTPLNSGIVKINPRESANQLVVLPTLNSYVISNNNSTNDVITPQNILNFDLPETKENLVKESTQRNKIWIGPVVGYNVWNDRISGEYIDPLTELLINEKTSKFS
ncbi:MAG: hypothetical protein IPN87_06415 [Saprospiraceae bacterium]|nr:hypothetical protein [Candidatus Brachybacter algidus]